MTENLRFFRALLTSPRRVGAIAPSGPVLAQSVAAQIDLSQAGPILELGPGTGSLTRGILARGIAPERLTLIEYDADMAKALATQFPGVRVIQGDAFDLGTTLGEHFTQPFIATVSGIPLLNYPPAQRRTLLDGAFARMVPGAPVIQFTYGLHSPVPASADMSATLANMVWMNFPPAHVWVFRKR